MCSTVTFDLCSSKFFSDFMFSCDKFLTSFYAVNMLLLLLWSPFFLRLLKMFTSKFLRLMTPGEVWLLFKMFKLPFGIMSSVDWLFNSGTR